MFSIFSPKTVGENETIVQEIILENLELQKERNLKETSPRRKRERSPPPAKMKNSKS